jgi:hypothetical protein
MEADEFQRSRDPIGGGHGTDAGPWLDTQIRNFGLSLNPRMGRGWAAPFICEGDC